MESDIDRLPVVTGVGLVTALGMSARETWESLMEGRAISSHSKVPGFLGPDRAVGLAERAAREAIGEAGWDRRICAAGDCGLFVGTSKGAIESWMSGENGGCHLFLGHLFLGGIGCEVAKRVGFGAGPRETISAACCSGLHALVRGVMGIVSGEIRRAMVVGVEASVHPLFISSFKRLGVLAPEGYGCRPMDVERKGFLVSEAAGAVCVEAAGTAVGRPMVRIDRWAVGGDGTHLTGGDPSGKALRRMFERVVGPGCDLIHAHATGTVINDPAELGAIPIGDVPPWVYSHKGALGHSLGAAGMVSVVINCLVHRTGMIPGNVKTVRPMEIGGLKISRNVVETKVRRSAVAAAGFGGPLGVIGLASD